MHKVYKRTGFICLGSLTALDNVYYRVALMVVTIILFTLAFNSSEEG